MVYLINHFTLSIGKILLVILAKR